MNSKTAHLILRAACIVALIALALMAWSLFDPRPIPVLVAMSVGQVLGTLSLGAYLVVVVADVRRRQAPPRPTDSWVPPSRP